MIGGLSSDTGQEICPLTTLRHGVRFVRYENLISKFLVQFFFFDLK